MDDQLDGMEDGHPTFDGPDEDDLTPEEREAERAFTRPLNPDPITALAKLLADEGRD